MGSTSRQAKRKRSACWESVPAWPADLSIFWAPPEQEVLVIAATLVEITYQSKRDPKGGGKTGGKIEIKYKLKIEMFWVELIQIEVHLIPTGVWIELNWAEFSRFEIFSFWPKLRLGQSDQNDLRPLFSLLESFLSMMFSHIFEAKKKAEILKMEKFHSNALFKIRS